MSRRAWLLAALGVAVVAFVANLMWPDTAATSGRPASNQQRRGTAARGQTDGVLNPDELKVRLEVLDEERPAPGGAERNPFRFKPTAPPAPPPGANTTAPPPTVPSVPPGPPAPPPITLKFMGIVVRENGARIAQLSDCKGATWAVAEGG
ncbi:MAG TPA: hypothetical protein VLD67_21165, partial [Vicinamibacterales bacterium]|nr:hypothetical protein [Vicinamibacterales bacterium]